MSDKIIDVVKTGNNIKRLCIEKDIKVADLANAMQISAPAIYKWMRGDGIPSIDNLIRLADILEITIDEIVVAS